MDEADLEIKEEVDTADPKIGQMVQFTITATNNGPNNATGVEVDDSLPVDFTISFTSVTQGTFDQIADVWMIGDLGINESATLIVKGYFTDKGEFNSSAIIVGDQMEPNLMNNTSNVDISVS